MNGQHYWFSYSEEELSRTLKTDVKQGLTEEEAQLRLRTIGPNVLAEKQKISPLMMFLGQFKDFMVLVLLVATLISGFLGEYVDAITIIAIVIINGILGFIQEYRAERSLSALKELTAPMAYCVRDGQLVHIPAKQLVPGDIIYLEGGDRIPADVRFLSANGLHVEESTLTGESVPVMKKSTVLPHEAIPLGDQINMGFMGTMVTAGTGYAVVLTTGMMTEMGKIAHLLQTTETLQTPLQAKLEQLGKILIAVALTLTALVVAAGIFHGQKAYEMFLAGVSLAVAAIPEGLPAIVTVALALGVQRMIRRRAIVRKLPSVETLGSASVICSDKTGTLTQNKMTVTHVWLENSIIGVTGTGYEPEGKFFTGNQQVRAQAHGTLYKLLQLGVLCNNAHLEHQQEERKGLFRKTEEQWVVNGDPTEGALLVAAGKADITRAKMEETWTRVREFPFDSTRKMMSVIVQDRYNKRMLVAKGAPDVLLSRCTHVLWKGHPTPLTPTMRRHIISANETLARQALRVLAIAYRDLRAGETPGNEQMAERGLVLVGLVGMIDPPRPEAKAAIRRCRQAGIKTVMITGDHQTTAEAIADQLSILPPGGLTLNGQDLYNMSDSEFESIVDNVYVYARVSPEHKLRIVKALQKRGHVVAMTGDGVNDAPAIKAADIGIAMGITGTDVTKEAASLVLADDNFATIEAAIEEGRTIYDNIRKFIRYLLASNVGEIMVMFFAMLAGLPLPLVPIQILWVNLVTDGLPALALGVDQPEEATMKRPPRSRHENVFARGLAWKIVSRGLLIGLVTLTAFWIAYEAYPGELTRAQTIAFATLVMAQLIHVFDCRSEISIFSRNPLQNKYLVLAVLSSVLLVLPVIYLPVLQPIFGTVALTAYEWLFIVLLAGIPTFATGCFSLLRIKSGKQGRVRES
ncbi:MULTISPECIES: calcium-translocating P-type ATPase, SERCA-type [Aneurinibacillus]|uniref:Ca2+-transporting ATPase n=1 Tax=Aneurinibacillus thermoaerophilus TaxID=143495 RepID=A0A1G7WA87_ANETH|nr:MULTISPECIES: calcium-translocating P-type ATPase, SERCA-type [Aneurinibacillus]AMA72602.1 ATPase [Aneurinibacillus sp. XH2]MED0674688.1 calcium-translocating P-type ATPase, SERCA-type [Aneurinibacillus thermoaerophilus]MED0736880.1 calcium-translocating P-type ATPase, SERCA-type [Aneurinibacillus thermoaerophilus]MED0756721.1 calcium-translocating P-type ATPase, SERCA-type [Aneurinibacillus thermoaerophilus]MED0760771.1 calcium-translocating P-type ATPase, SERCA-type [Aneurinibacillus ther